MLRYSLRQRFRYRFDNALSRSVWVVLLWLGGLAATFLLTIALVMWLTRIGPGDEPTSFMQGIWYAMTRSLSASAFRDDKGTVFRLIMMLVTFTGIFLGAAIIGLICSWIDRRLDEMRRGQSLVIEEGHTLVIGQSDKLPLVISELVEANRSERGRAIVVFCDRDTVEVSREIRRELKDLGTSRLVVRNGKPTRLSDLARVNPQLARAAIVLDEGGSAAVVNTVLGLHQLIPKESTAVIVAEVDDLDVASALKETVGERLIVVTPARVVARITAQVSRASGLGAVYQELLDFAGDEMYSTSIPANLIGRTFGELELASSRGTIFGLRTAAGDVLVNPHPTRVLVSGDEAIGIAADDSVFSIDLDPPVWQPARERVRLADPWPVANVLMIGWSSLGSLVVGEMESHVAPGSTLVVLVDEDVHEADALTRELSSLQLTNLSWSVRVGDAIGREVIARALDEREYAHVILLCERQHFEVDEADARVLLALMQVRAHTKGGGGNVVAELLDPNRVELAGASDGHDFIVSQRLVSLLLTQLSQSPHLAPVLEDLFDADGSAVAMHPIERYVDPRPMTFAEVIAAVRETDAVAIGYRSASAIGQKGALPGGIRVNPPKFNIVAFAPGDAVIAITGSSSWPR